MGPVEGGVVGGVVGEEEDKECHPGELRYLMGEYSIIVVREKEKGRKRVCTQCIVVRGGVWEVEGKREEGRGRRERRGIVSVKVTEKRAMSYGLNPVQFFFTSTPIYIVVVDGMKKRKRRSLHAWRTRPLPCPLQLPLLHHSKKDRCKMMRCFNLLILKVHQMWKKLQEVETRRYVHVTSFVQLQWYQLPLSSKIITGKS